jgi:hypothetical protein
VDGYEPMLCFRISTRAGVAGIISSGRQVRIFGLGKDLNYKEIKKLLTLILNFGPLLIHFMVRVEKLDSGISWAIS